MGEELSADLEHQALDLAAIVICDLDGCIRHWTGGMQQICGYSAEEAVGRLAHTLLQIEFPAGADIQSALQAQGGWTGELGVRRRDGVRAMMQTKMIALHSATGEPRAFAVLAVDLGQAGQAAVDRATLASIVESSHDAIIGKTLDGIVTSWNKAAEDTFGYAAEEMIGRPLTILFPPHLLTEEDDILARLARGERVEHFETTRLHKDGTTIEVSLSISPVRDVAGRVVGAAKIVRDITGQKQVRARLDELQAQLLHISRLNDMNQMATGLAHELNQPLSAISNYISGAQKLIAQGNLKRATEGCERAAEQVARAGEVIRRLRDFIGRAEARRSAEALSPLLEESVALALLGVTGGPLSVETKVAPTTSPALIDRTQIQQVIVNLVRNAVEAMEGAPQRRLRLTAVLVDGGLVEVAVADTGSGLSADVRDRLFQPFTTTKETGMGVGLSLCRSIVEAHGGRIWAEDRPGGGAIFRFTLPTG